MFLEPSQTCILILSVNIYHTMKCKVIPSNLKLPVTTVEIIYQHAALTLLYFLVYPYIIQKLEFKGVKEEWKREGGGRGC